MLGLSARPRLLLARPPSPLCRGHARTILRARAAPALRCLLGSSYGDEHCLKTKAAALVTGLAVATVQVRGGVITTAGLGWAPQPDAHLVYGQQRKLGCMLFFDDSQPPAVTRPLRQRWYCPPAGPAPSHKHVHTAPAPQALSALPALAADAALFDKSRALEAELQAILRERGITLQQLDSSPAPRDLGTAPQVGGGPSEPS